MDSSPKVKKMRITRNKLRQLIREMAHDTQEDEFTRAMKILDQVMHRLGDDIGDAETNRMVIEAVELLWRWHLRPEPGYGYKRGRSPFPPGYNR